VSVAVEDTVMAEPRACVRCSKLSLLWVVGRCADCVAEMGLQDDRTEYDTWKSEVKAEYGSK
jgi:hypothetical protein